MTVTSLKTALLIAKPTQLNCDLAVQKILRCAKRLEKLRRCFSVEFSRRIFFCDPSAMKNRKHIQHYFFFILSLQLLLSNICDSVTPIYVNDLDISQTLPSPFVDRTPRPRHFIFRNSVNVLQNDEQKCVF